MQQRRIATIFLTILSTATVNLWASGGLLSPTERLIDEVTIQAQRNPELHDAAMHFLRVVAEGRNEEISIDLLAGFFVREGIFHPLALTDKTIRALAFEHIGRLATPEALAYLQSIDRSQFSAVEDQPMEKAVVVGIYFARLGQITDQQRRWEFQAGLLAQRTVNRGDGDVKGWALNGLCSDGALAFLPDVEAYHRRWGSSPEEEDRIQRCKAKMLLVASHRDRVTGLSKALTRSDDKEARMLRVWAIRELGEMNTRESRAALQRFIENNRDLNRLLDTPRAQDLRLAEAYLTRLAP